MADVQKLSDTGERYVEATLDLIAERGGSGGVNLRQISRRVGCAHTNAYNYFDSYQALLWEAFRRTLAIYGEWLTRDLNDTLSREDYLRQLLTNLATFPQAESGLYRFIASDPMPISEIPNDILDTVGEMKHWLAAALASVTAKELSTEDAATIADMVLAYVDGETLNLINERVVPGEDVPGRVVANALRIYRLLVQDCSARHPSARRPPGEPYPKLSVHRIEKGT